MRTVMSCLVLATILPLGTSVAGEEKKADDSTPSCPLIYINTAFENASPLYWEIGDSGEVNVFLMYDHERASPNRAAGHWHFRVEAPKGACPGPTNLYSPFGWADLPIPPVLPNNSIRRTGAP